MIKFEKKNCTYSKNNFFHFFFPYVVLKLMIKIARQLQYCENVSLLMLLFLKSLLVCLMDILNVMILLKIV